MHSWELFKKIHRSANLSPEILELSLHPMFNQDQVFKAGEGAGRSGSFFFFSHDSRFIIKTMTESERKQFICILPEYAEHLHLNPNSLLAKILGIFTVKQQSTDPVCVMLMENTLRVEYQEDLMNVFDLKGSSVDRRAPEDAGTLKDINFKKKCNIPDFLELSSKDSVLKYLAVEKDVAFLKACGLMDYSLLVGIEVPRPKGSLAETRPTALTD
jgi:hypothetical protein